MKLKNVLAASFYKTNKSLRIKTSYKTEMRQPKSHSLGLSPFMLIFGNRSHNNKCIDLNDSVFLFVFH